MSNGQPNSTLNDADPVMTNDGALHTLFALSAALCVMALSTAATALTVPQFDRPVIDESDSLSEARLLEFNEMLKAHYDSTGVQIAVLVVDSAEKTAMERASFPSAQGWAGPTVERDDGILIVFAVDDRQMHIARGYGIASILPDNYADNIVEHALSARLPAPQHPVLRAIDGVIDQTDHIEPGAPLSHRPRPLGAFGTLTIPLLFVFAIVQVFLWRRYKKLHGSWNESGLTTGKYFRHPFEFADVVLWALPAALVMLVFWEAGFWRPMAILWLLMALAVSLATRFLDPILYLSVGAILMVCFTGVPLHLGFFPATYEEIVAFVTGAGLMGVVAATFIVLYATFDSIEKDRLRSGGSGAANSW